MTDGSSILPSLRINRHIEFIDRVSTTAQLQPGESLSFLLFSVVLELLTD